MNMHPPLFPPGPFTSIDLHFARFMMRLSGSANRDLALAAALLSSLCRQGHTCMDLAAPLASLDADEGLLQALPKPEAWIASLRQESVVGSPGDFSPLILDPSGRLSFHRTHEQERLLANRLIAMSTSEQAIDMETLKKAVSRMFPSRQDQDELPQKLAALIAASRSLCVITGGPGTGKTTLVTKILALLLMMDPGLTIALAAPTGKAARRIAESIQAGVERLDCPEDVRSRIPREATTLHRLLGFTSGSVKPRRGPDNPLVCRVVVVDEASMADLALMAALVQALPADGRLILLGDRNQLASVAAGFVLGDICDTGTAHAYSPRLAHLAARVIDAGLPSTGRPGMQDSIVELTKTYRFSEHSPIFMLSAAVNEGNAAKCREILTAQSAGGILHHDLPGPGALREALRPVVLAGYGACLGTPDPRERLRLFEAFRVLCPVREGPYGVAAMNRLIEGILADEGLLDPSGLHYDGRPVLVTENDYGLNLFNGDIGVTVREGETLRVCFPGQDGSVRQLSPTRLPAHETAFAMTVHKSQGSEFDRILLVLPDRDSPVLCRELVYTAITRARCAMEIWARGAILSRAVSRRTYRSSGLSGMLWGQRA
jgi:exodeoxyribonuclease V alpha subunit